MRPATENVFRFIDAYHAEFGVAPICRALSANGVPIARRSYYAWRDRPPSKRALWDLAVAEILAGYYDPDSAGRKKPESLYGATKMWAHLNRQGIQVARCTVERLMRANGWRGATRAARPRTTIRDPHAPRVPDLVHRQFGVDRPNQLWVADLTYVPAAGGYLFTAFVIDAFAGAIPGWQVAARATGQMVKQALAFAIEKRARDGHPLAPGLIHHSDAGTQYTSLHFTNRLLDANIAFSVGSVGDALDNALAETTIGLYKTECLGPASPFLTGPLNTVADVEAVTAPWVHWYNTSRLMHRLGRRPPLEAEAEYYAQHPTGDPVKHQ